MTDELPPRMGETPIPEGHLRLFHQSPPDNIESIREHGLSLDRARGIEGPKAVWAQSGKPFYGHSDSPVIEFHLPAEEVAKGPVTGGAERVVRGQTNAQDWNGEQHIVALNGNVSPAQFAAVHLPWHNHARYILDSEDMTRRVRAGEHDDLLEDPDYGPAIRYVKGMVRS